MRARSYFRQLILFTRDLGGSQRACSLLRCTHFTATQIQSNPERIFLILKDKGKFEITNILGNCRIPFSLFLGIAYPLVVEAYLAA